MIGTGGTYGSDIEQFAPNFRIYYGVNEHLCFGPEFTLFYLKTNENKWIKLKEYGFVVHYIFELKEHFGIYPLIGMNYSVEENKHSGSIHAINSLGASIGTGLHLNWKNILPYLEYKYTTGTLSQSTLSLGLVYNFNLKSEHRNE
jgi:hypothetical protein